MYEFIIILILNEKICVFLCRQADEPRSPEQLKKAFENIRMAGIAQSIFELFYILSRPVYHFLFVNLSYSRFCAQGELL